MTQAFFLCGEDINPRGAVSLLRSVLASNLEVCHESKTSIKYKKHLRTACAFCSVLFLCISVFKQVEGCAEGPNCSCFPKPNLCGVTMGMDWKF